MKPDHEEAKRIAERFVAASLRELPGPPFYPDPPDAATLARAYLDLLTEHSALIGEVQAVAALGQNVLVWTKGHNRAVTPTDIRVMVGRLKDALPATESAQLEEER